MVKETTGSPKVPNHEMLGAQALRLDEKQTLVVWITWVLSGTLSPKKTLAPPSLKQFKDHWEHLWRSRIFQRILKQLGHESLQTWTIIVLCGEGKEKKRKNAVWVGHLSPKKVNNQITSLCWKFTAWSHWQSFWAPKWLWLASCCEDPDYRFEIC